MAECAERGKIPRSNDHVIDQFNFQNSSGVGEVAGRDNVRIGWRAFAAGMVMHQNNSIGGGQHGEAVNLTRRNEQTVLRPQRNDLMPFDARARVEKQDHEAFDFGIKIGIAGNMHAPIIGGDIGRFAERQGIRRRALAQGHHLEFMRGCGESKGRNQIFKPGENGCAFHNR